MTTTTGLRAYRGDPQLKADLLAQLDWHAAQDMIAKGTYGEFLDGRWRGCAVGCSIHSLNRMHGNNIPTNEHRAYETELGIPEWLARLEDTLFENLPQDLALAWPRRFAAAIPVGADLGPVKWRFCAFLMARNIDRVLTLDIADELKTQVVDAIRGVLALHTRAAETGVWDESAAWSAAGSAAWSAAWSAWSAAGSAAGSAAWSAESAAESAARSAAESAARSAAWSAAESAEYVLYADKLIELLEVAP